MPNKLSVSQKCALWASKANGILGGLGRVLSADQGGDPASLLSFILYIYIYMCLRRSASAQWCCGQEAMGRN